MGDLHTGTGPRERIYAHGPEGLSDAELLTLLLGTGSRHRSAAAVAAALVDENGLLGLGRLGVGELVGTHGLGPAKAAAVVAALEIGRRVAGRRLDEGAALQGPRQVFEHFHPRLRHEPHERLLVVLLDGRHRVQRTVTASQGTLTASLVHPREVFRPALRESAAAVIVVHNHPSGDPTPSEEDRQVTRRLADAGQLLGVPLLDHVVVAERGYASLREEGVLDDSPRGSEERARETGGTHRTSRIQAPHSSRR